MADQIFISYRRGDAAYVTGHINDLLRKAFGDDAVFTDVDNIALGVDFRAVLDETVSQCKVFLAVIGSEWLTVTDQDGQRRLEDPADFVRIEIESALARNIPVIPLLVAGATMPAPEELPESLKALAFRNGTQIRPAPDFQVDMARLIKNLRRHFDDPGVKIDDDVEESPAAAEAQPAKPSKPRQQAAGIKVEVAKEDLARHRAEVDSSKRESRKSWAARLALLAVVIVAAGSWYYLNPMSEPPQAVGPEITEPTPEAAVTAEAGDTNEPAGVADVGPPEDIPAQVSAGATFAPAETETAAAVAVDMLEETGAEVETESEPVTEPAEAAIDEPVAEAESEPESNGEVVQEEPAVVEIVETPDLQADQAELVGEGVRFAAIGEHEAAIENFTAAIELDEEQPFFYKQRGASYQALGEFDAAVSDYDEAIRLSSDDVNAYYRRGVSHSALQNYEAAIADFDIVIELDAEYLSAYLRRADAHEALGDTEAAARDRETAAGLQ